MSTSDELNLAQDRSTSGFVSAARQLKIDWTKFSRGQIDITFHCCLTGIDRYLKDSMIIYTYISLVKYFELRICSFYENSNLKKCNSVAHLKRVSET